ncbi:MAG: hypothetical protein OQJ84_03600, partial [Xanthomonadales bacterium]|nr:hypothetical protein [Xanthomonadales bacterium]
PLWKMLGGTGGHVYPYMSTGSTHDHDQATVSKIGKRAVDEGFRGIKIRVKSTDINRMTDFVGAARDAVGAGTHLMVDANQGWPVDLLDETPKWDLPFALKFARAVEAFDVKWLEEPLNRGDFAGLAELRKNTSTPVAGGELNSSWCDFKTMLESGSLDVYQPDAVMAGGTYAGGISVVYWLINEIQRRNHENTVPGDTLKFCPHTWTTGLGFAVALQLVGVVPPERRSLLEYPLEGHWQPEHWARFVKGGFPIGDDRSIRIPDQPGLGIEIDWGVIRKFGKRIYRGTPANVATRAMRDRGLKQALYLKGKKAQQLERSSKAEFSIPLPPF